jgi:hypothetical protein
MLNIFIYAENRNFQKTIKKIKGWKIYKIAFIGDSLTHGNGYTLTGENICNIEIFF